MFGTLTKAKILMIMFQQSLRELIIFWPFCTKLEYMDSETFVNLYNFFVHLILEYSNVVWGPHYIPDQIEIC